jgi:hypothetical protein
MANYRYQQKQVVYLGNKTINIIKLFIAQMIL